MKRMIEFRPSDRPSLPAPPTIDVERVRRIWDEYQKQHDITPLIDQTAGIDPGSGRIWFGESGLDVRRKMRAEGIDVPIYCVRVGYEHYLRKGSRR
jgi:hypothetical protein